MPLSDQAAARPPQSGVVGGDRLADVTAWCHCVCQGGQTHFLDVVAVAALDEYIQCPALNTIADNLQNALNE